jgi:hypothetical protein
VKKKKARSLKLKAIKFCISNENLYWRDPAGILLNFLDENEAKQVMTKMHRGACGGHKHWMGEGPILKHYFFLGWGKAPLVP